MSYPNRNMANRGIEKIVDAYLNDLNGEGQAVYELIDNLKEHTDATVQNAMDTAYNSGYEQGCLDGIREVKGA